MYIVLNVFQEIGFQDAGGNMAKASFQSMVLGNTNPLGVCPAFHTLSGALGYLDTLDEEVKLTVPTLFQEEDGRVGLLSYAKIKEDVNGKKENISSDNS